MTPADCVDHRGTSAARTAGRTARSGRANSCGADVRMGHRHVKGHGWAAQVLRAAVTACTGNSPGQGRDRWGSGKRAVDRPRATHWGAVRRGSDVMTGHRGKAGHGLGSSPEVPGRTTGSGRVDLNAKNRGVRRSRSRGREVSCHCGAPGGPGAGRFVAVLRTQRRQTGHGHSGALGGLPDRTGFTCVRLSVAAVMAFRLLPRRLRQRGNRDALMFGSWLEMPARRHDALLGDEMTHRRVRADGMRVQQAEEEETQPQHTRQRR